MYNTLYCPTLIIEAVHIVFTVFFPVFKNSIGTSLVVQWLRIHLLMQRTWVRSLVQEDPTCCGATKPMRHNYWAHVPQLLKPVHPRACALQLLSPRAATTEAHAPRARAPQEKPLQ